MKESATLEKLAKALRVAQSIMGTASKDSVNPHFKSKYADLASVWDACRKPLTANGLTILQPVSCDGSNVTITTRLLHESGEFIEESLTLQATQNTPQAIGSAITYGRRYGLSSMIGIAADEDDDGHQASYRSIADLTHEQVKILPTHPVKIEPSTWSTESVTVGKYIDESPMIDPLAGFAKVPPDPFSREHARAEHSFELPPPTNLLDTSTGEEVPRSDAPEPPIGFHYISSYEKKGQWYEFSINGYCADGSAMKFSTKFEPVGKVAEQAFQFGIPVQVEWTPKKKGTSEVPGEAYAGKVHKWTKAIQTEPMDPVTLDKIPF